MTNTTQLKEDASAFLLAAARSRDYTKLNPEAIALGETEALDNLGKVTDRVHSFLARKIRLTYPRRITGVDTNLPLDKRFPEIKDPIQGSRVYEFLNYFIEESENRIPIWYNETGVSYFKYSGVETLLSILKAK